MVSDKKNKLLAKVKEVWVKNKDGSVEKFNKEKIKNSLIKIGAPIKLASKIASRTSDLFKKKKEVKTSEVEKKVFELAAKNSISLAYAFKEFTTQKVFGKVRQQFTRKEVARMLTCLFVIIQIYAFRTDFFPLNRSLLILSVSIIVSSIVLWLYVGRSEMWKHLIVGILISLSLSAIAGLILNIELEGVIIATSAALPVSTMVNVLRS